MLDLDIEAFVERATVGEIRERIRLGLTRQPREISEHAGDRTREPRRETRCERQRERRREEELATVVVDARLDGRDRLDGDDRGSGGIERRRLRLERDGTELEPSVLDDPARSNRSAGDDAPMPHEDERGVPRKRRRRRECVEEGAVHRDTQGKASNDPAAARHRGRRCEVRPRRKLPVGAALHQDLCIVRRGERA